MPDLLKSLETSLTYNLPLLSALLVAALKAANKAALFPAGLVRGLSCIDLPLLLFLALQYCQPAQARVHDCSKFSRSWQYT